MDEPLTTARQAETPETVPAEETPERRSLWRWPLRVAALSVVIGLLVLLGVNAQDLKSDALAFSREFDTPYVSVRDRGNRTHQDYGLTGVPETYYLDADGRIVGHTPDAISRASLERVIAQAIGGAAR